MSKICTELDAHLGLADKTLAEFIIHLAEEHTDPKVRACVPWVGFMGMPRRPIGDRGI